MQNVLESIWDIAVLLRFSCRLSLVALLAACSSASDDGGSGSAKLKQAPCVTGRGTTTLYEGTVTGVAVDGNQIVVASDAIVRVPLAGGAPVAVATPQTPFGLLVLNGVAYFTAEQLMGAPDPQGKQSSQSVVESVPIAGGEPTILPGNPLDFTFGGATDETSLYVGTYGLGTIAKLTPPATTVVALPLDGNITTDAIAVQGDYVYVAGQDFGVSGMNNGVIERIPKNGGRAERIVSSIGHPWSLVADDNGLYWVQEPPAIVGTGTIAHSALDGSSASTLVATTAISLAVAYGRLYFADGKGIQSISTSGGDITTLATGLTTPGMLLVAGGNVVWVDPISKARSDPTVPKVMTTCVP